MVKIRLTRIGRHKKPFFRLVAIDSRSARDSSYIELLGTLEPKNGTTNLNKEAILKWLNLGAQPTETARNLLSKAGIWKEFKLAKDQAKQARPKASPKVVPAKPKTTATKKPKLSAAKPTPNAEIKVKIAIKKTIAKKAKIARSNAKKNLQKKLITAKKSSVGTKKAVKPTKTVRATKSTSKTK